MMIKPVFILLVILMAHGSTIHAQGFKRNAHRDPKANVGIKAGFNSSMFSIDHFTIGGYELQYLQNNYKIGYLGAFFCRFNLKKHHFIQTELSYNIQKGSISIPHIGENKKYLKDNAVVKSVMHNITLPLLYGYKFIDSYPYGMAFFVGPQVSYNWYRHTHHEYSGFYQVNLSESIKPFTANAVIGLAVNVSNIFFDFRYEVGIRNITHHTYFDRNQTPEPYKDYGIQVKRRNHVLSFSAGVIF